MFDMHTEGRVLIIFKEKENQRTSGHVNAQLIFGCPLPSSFKEDV